MPRKTASESFNNVAPSLLESIFRARGMLREQLMVTERLFALGRIREACEILEKKMGIPSSTAAAKAAFAQYLEKYRAEQAGEFTRERIGDNLFTPRFLEHCAETREVRAYKADSAAFGLLDSLLNKNAKQTYVLARMGDKRRLEICQRARQHVEDSILFELLSLDLHELVKKMTPPVPAASSPPKPAGP